MLRKYHILILITLTIASSFTINNKELSDEELSDEELRAIVHQNYIQMNETYHIINQLTDRIEKMEREIHLLMDQMKQGWKILSKR
jgi:hypothetical protein